MRVDERSIAYFLVAAVAVSVVFVGCATPAELVRLQPESVNVTWVAGRAVVAKEDAGVRVAAAFEHQDGNMLALRLEVENGTEEPLLVGPGDVAFSVCSTKQSGSCTPARRVYDPEHVLNALDTKRSIDEAAAINEQAFLGTMVMLSAVGAVTSIASGRTDSTTGLSTLGLAGQMAHADAAHDSARSSLASQRQMWSNAALRRNTLAPGRGVSGMIFVPIALNARYVWLVLRMGSRTFSFQFQQTVRRIGPH